MIINEVEKLGEHGYGIEIKGKREWIKEECEKIKALSKFIVLHDKKSPADVHRELMLVGIDKEKEGEYATKILLRECEARRTGTSKSNECKSGSVVAVIGIRVWKGCVKRYRIRSGADKGYRRERRKPKPIVEMESRRVFSISIVGRRDVAGIINILLTAHLRQASGENILCVDE